jgi:iron(III)-enterobactin esterase
VAVANGGGHTGGGGCGERALEYGTLSDRYARFVEREVLPAVLRNVAVRRAFPKLRFTSDASGRASMGCSEGGVAALTMAFFAPDFVTRVAAYSPAAVDLQCGAQPAKVAHPLGGREYWDGQRLIETQAKRPGMRVWVNNNEFDLGWGGNCADSAPAVDKLPGNTTAEYFAGCWASWDCDPPGSCADAPLHSFSLGANRTAAALQAAGYEYRHVYGLNQWHCGNKLGTPDGTPDVWTQTLPSTLEWMWQGYQH